MSLYLHRMGLMCGALRQPLASLEWLNSQVDAVDRSTYTFNGVGFGTPAPDRQILVGIVHRGSGNRAVSSVTIGGNAAVRLGTEYRNAAGSNTSGASLWMANVPTGASGTIVVGLNASVARLGMDVYRASQLDYTPHDQNETATGQTLGLNALAGGYVLGTSYGHQNYPTASVTPTGWALDSVTFIEGGSNPGSIASASAPVLSDGSMSVGLSWTSNTLSAAKYLSLVPAPRGFSTDFGSVPIGQSPPGLTAVVGALPTVETLAGSLSGRALRFPLDTTTSWCVWANAAQIADAQVLMRIRFPDVASTVIQSRAVALLRATAASPLDCYYAGEWHSAAGVMTRMFGKQEAGVNTFLATGSADITPTASDFIWVRFEVQGTTLRWKHWIDGTAEPTTWTSTLTDSSISAAGLPGVSSYNSSGNNGYMWVDYYAYGPWGAPLPLGV